MSLRDDETMERKFLDVFTFERSSLFHYSLRFLDCARFSLFRLGAMQNQVRPTQDIQCEAEMLAWKEIVVGGTV
jgi:hypothetical protein